MGTKKINDALGIGNIDDLLKDLDVDEQSRQLSEIEKDIQENIDSVDSQIEKYNEQGITGINISDLGTSLNEIKDLIDISKQTIRHVYEQITDQELTDSELVQALSKLIESSHLAIKEYVDIFKDRVSFYDKVRLEAIKHNYKIQQMREKNRLDIEKAKATQVQKEIQVDMNTIKYSQEDILNEV